MEQQGTKKRRKVTLLGSRGDGQQRGTAITLTSAVVADPLQQMVGFLEYSERLTLVLSCKPMYRTVEAYSQAALAKIEQDYHVDETFAERLRDPSRIGEHQPVSGDLPYRYLLKAARFTYLYTLEMMFPRSSGFSCASALSKDGRRLVVAATAKPLRLVVYSWDVTAEPGAKKIYEIPAETALEYHINDVFCMEELIVLCTNLRILTLAVDTGELTRAYVHPTMVISVVLQGASGVVFLDADNKIFSFNVSTGMAQSQLSITGDACNGIAGLLKDRWLVVSYCDIGTRADFRVFDLSNGCRQSCFFGGRFSAVEQSRTSPDVFYTFDYNHSQVLQLSEQGIFSVVRSLILPSWSNETYWQEGPLSRWFFEKKLHPYGGAETSMTVRCAKSGKLLGCYKLPTNHDRASGMHIQSNGKKLFVGLESMRGDGVCVAAFLAKWHF